MYIIIAGGGIAGTGVASLLVEKNTMLLSLIGTGKDANMSMLT
jgi:Trk K+ transport system NAD-binding subunit